MLFLSVTLLAVPENLGLSSPVRDSWESTYPCNDHLDLVHDGKYKNKKEYLIVVGAQVWKPVGHSICPHV